MFGTILRWLVRHFLTFLIIVAILLLGRMGWTEWEEYQSVMAESPWLTNANKDLSSTIERLAHEVSERADGLRSNSLQKIEFRITEVNKEINALHRKIAQQPDTLVNVLEGTLLQAHIEGMQLAVETNILEQELSYLRDLRQGLAATQSRQVLLADLARLQAVHQRLYSEWQTIRAKKEDLVQLYPVKSRILGLPQYDERERLEDQQKSLVVQNHKADADYKRQLILVQAPQRPVPPLLPFELRRDGIDEILQPVRQRLMEVNQRRLTNWFEKILKPIEELFLTALGILTGIILMPIVIKAMFYFVLAPLASRRPAICLLPETSGELELVTGRSAVSQAVSVDADHELLIHPEFLQSSSLRGDKDTRWIMDWNYPMTSLASGMVALTRIRTCAPESFVLSATKDPLSEIGILSIAQGAALVMQPHNLVGLLQPRGSPLRITSHWRLFSLHAWLTLQLRYLAFHGPAKLIVQGCRGVRIESADASRSINQAAMIGFSANVSYSTRRSETFGAYMLGKQELLNDNFCGHASHGGFYVYEEMPHHGKKSGMARRGLEGLTDSLLKVFGS